MREIMSLLVSGILLTGGASAAPAENTDPFEFFEKEAQVVTASRQPQPIRQAPATVYVVTGEDIRASGSETLWDALRGVPGVDVMSTRTFQGEVSIRGLNKSLNNRTLVLLDGKTVLNGYFDNMNWEGIPVTLEEIDRIEVVEGPASALYGANAINGVINIITRTPEQLKGGRGSYTVGQKGMHLGTFLCGDQGRDAGYKLGAGWRSTNRFEDASLRASKVVKLHTLLSRQFSKDAQLSVSGGVAHLNTQMAVSALGTAFEDGAVGFVRTDFRHRNTRFRAFWNRGRTTLRGTTILQNPDLDYDTYDLNLERSWDLHARQVLVVGVGYRRNATRSRIFPPGLLGQNLWALFFEDEWKAGQRLTLVVSGRLDKHPFTDLTFSPRGSILFTPLPQHVFRVSAGTSFRNPTLIENYLQWSQTLRVPPAGSLELTVLGNRSLKPEKMLTMEVAHSGRLGRLKTVATGFHYRLRDIIVPTPLEITSFTPPTIGARTSFGNNRGKTRAWGGELEAELRIHRWVVSFVNYSYQRLKGELDPLAARAGGPKHKVNGGVRLRAGGLTAGLRAHRVAQTVWNQNAFLDPAPKYEKVDDYILLNAHLGYAFSGHLKGLEVRISAFNLGGNEHYQVLPGLSAIQPGQNGEIVRSRWTGNVFYQF